MLTEQNGGGVIMITWSVAFTIAYKDDTTKYVEVVQDKGGVRLSMGSIDDWRIARRLPKFSAFTGAYGFGFTPNLPNNIASYNYRFTATATNGHVNVLGSSSELSPGAIINSALVVSELLADDGFAAYLVPSATVLINTTYIDYDPDFVDEEAEGSNIISSLLEYGVDVKTFTDITAEGIAAALVDVDLILIPETEKEPLIFSTEAATILRNFVSNGGTLVSMNFTSFGEPTIYLNQIFTWSLSLTEGSGSDINKTVNADSSGFTDCVSTLPYNDDVSGFAEESLPAGSITIYKSSDSVYVVLMPYDQGTVIFLGWDWYNAEPIGSVDGGWLQVLYTAITL